MSGQTVLGAVNVLAELERCGVKYASLGGDEVKVLCPFHDDTEPNCSINLEKRVFSCTSPRCGHTGDFATYLAGLLRTSRAGVVIDLMNRYGSGTSPAKIIDANLVEEYHSAIWAADPLLKELRERGVTDQDIREYRLGEHRGRVTIPIPDESGVYVNIRGYMPGAPRGQRKMINVKGYGVNRLYPIKQLSFERIVLCGGEIKAMVAARQLNPLGIGAISTTVGEGAKGKQWDDEMIRRFRDKHVWVCLDIDKAGIAGARLKAMSLHGVAKWVGVVALPLDPTKYPKGDINDFIGREKGELMPVLETTAEWRPPTRTIPFSDHGDPESILLHDAMHASQTGKRVTLRATVSQMDTTPYVVPCKLRVLCDRAQVECGMCQVSASGVDEHEIPPESPAILEMIAAPLKAQRDAVMRGIGVPTSCESFQHEVLDYYNVEDARVSPQLDITATSSERKMQPAMCIGKQLDLNENYVFTGRMHPHPKTQQSTLLISEYKPTQDSLSTYAPTGESLERLKVFRPKEWTVDSIDEKLREVYTEFENHVTRIFLRRDAHLMVDLAYHSPLLVPLDGKVTKGWVEVLIVGDSSQGKSELTCGREGKGGLMAHYGLGEKVECKNATVAGLLGGMQQIGNRWFATWGKIPTHDRRLVILEELKGAAIEVIAKITDMRSSGVAEIDKIEQRKAHARTRLVALSNPRSDRPMSAYSFGIEVVKELVGALEDVRRFDAVLVMSKSEVNAAELNRLQTAPPYMNGGRKFASEVCRELILWAWTRGETQVLVPEDTVKEISRAAVTLCDEFTEAVPIVDRGSMRQKLTRLAASLACRTFSEIEGSVVVRPCHVQYIEAYLRRIYNAPALGYADYTAAIRLTESLVDPEKIVARLNTLPYPGDFVKAMLHTQEIQLGDIQDWTDWVTRDDALGLLSFLVRKHGLLRDGRCYRKTSPMITLLKNMLTDGSLIDRPDFMKGEEEF